MTIVERWNLRWWEAAPEAVLVAGLALFTLTEFSAASSAFSSATALALMAGTGALWVVGRLLLLRCTKRPALRVTVFGLAAAGVLAIVVLPAYRNTTVVETLPAVAAPTTAVAPPTTVVPTTVVAPAATPTTVETTTVPDRRTTAPTAPEATAATSTPTAPPAGPVAVRSGALRGIDHRATGSAVVYRRPDGSVLVGLEDIDIQPGPDYDVYVVPGAGREDVDGGTRLDDLRGNRGTQYYEVPAGVDLVSGSWTVLVWCQTFDVPVAGATPG